MRKTHFKILFIIVLLLQLQIETVQASEGVMEVHFINVGQGDSILIQTPEQEHILIDGGPPEASAKVLDYLEEQKVQELDLLIATHPDIDHIGGLLPIINQFPIKEIWDSGKFYYTRTYHRYFRNIKKKNIPLHIVKLNTVKALSDNTSLIVLNANSILKTNNQSSLALQLTMDNIDFLLMSDVEKKQELKIMQRTDVDAEILKVAHHGSDTSSSFAFLQAVDPEIAILSYGKDNTYGHPVRVTVDHLLAVGATIYSTAKAGDIVITTDGDNYNVTNSGLERLLIKPFR
ncbi:ComEC family competence protein [Paraliobacillus sp. PM-2]|uniref:ComEC/Rec2 family competence protein n=1 Tax=Paraliobacillus sp. PM-2 TaxID=1462524 RepID=UPI00061BDC1F|nr:MBL fold metallo-hydrolase [Paraliobacillus sp. PM-2]CQR47263.1 ComEC family competence protein [Paraliobacillus sp. PM-2]